MPTARDAQRGYLVLMLANTLAASFIWGIALHAGRSKLSFLERSSFSHAARLSTLDAEEGCSARRSWFAREAWAQHVLCAHGVAEPGCRV
jgi:hypothetical protein